METKGSDVFEATKKRILGGFYEDRHAIVNKLGYDLKLFQDKSNNLEQEGILTQVYESYKTFLILLETILGSQNTEETLHDFGAITGNILFFDHIDEDIVIILQEVNELDLPPSAMAYSHFKTKKIILGMIDIKLTEIKKGNFNKCLEYNRESEERELLKQ